jgi:regulator of RNase E activity RraA
MSSANRTAAFSDSLDKLGQRIGALLPSIAAMTASTTMHGRARTVHMVQANSDSDDPYDEAIDFIDSLRPGDVVVIATQDSAVSAVWGELFTAAAKGRGAHGVVTDGCVRDIAGVRALTWPVFAAGTRPVDYRARQRIRATDVPVALGGVPVSPGDLVLADDDGVVVVPQELEAETLQLVEQRAATEATVLEELLAGATLREVWERHRVL